MEHRTAAADSEVKQTQIYDDFAQAIRKTILKQKNKLPKQLVRSVGRRYGVQRVLLNLSDNST